MAHYAFLDDKNIVTEVIVGIDETELIEGIQPEIWYGNFKNQNCKRTSFNGKIRGTFAGVGFFYDAVNDIFIAPKPWPSWIQNGSFWDPPVPMPIAKKVFEWDESILNWVVREPDA